LARYHEVLRRGLDAILRLVRPGVEPSELFRSGMEAVRSGGIPHYQRHHVGHAVGLEFYEAPILNDTARSGSAKVRLEEGMVINIELPYYELGLGGLQIEETLVVRQDGYELLTTSPREMLRAGTRAAGGTRAS
jgi:Xaa-Pro aminopeptidase